MSAEIVWVSLYVACLVCSVVGLAAAGRSVPYDYANPPRLVVVAAIAAVATGSAGALVQAVTA